MAAATQALPLHDKRKEGDPKVQFHKDKLINSKLFMVIDIAESLITILKRSLTRLFYSLNLQSVISLKI